jgi:GWxTD domain-containing protein
MKYILTVTSLITVTLSVVEVWYRRFVQSTKTHFDYTQCDKVQYCDNSTRKYLFFSILLLTISLMTIESSFAQKQQFNRASFYSYGTRLFSEAHVLPDKSPDSINVMVLYKVVHEALVFIQVNPLENPGHFQAFPTVEIFFRDKTGIIRNRTLLSDTVWVNNYEETQSKDLYAHGYSVTKLAISDYTCTVQLLDRYRKPADKNELNIKSNVKFLREPVISDPIFAHSSDRLIPTQVVPFILGNNINFTSLDAKILIPVSYKKLYNVFNYNIEKNINKDDKFWNDSIRISGRVVPVESSYLTIGESSIYPLLISINQGFTYDENFGTDILTGILNIELPSVQLSPGTYSLTIGVDGITSDTAKFNFDVIWVDMPLAMRNPAYAIEVMYYILNDDEYKAMKSGSDEDKAKKVMDYWKLKDPTKSTPYNEAMTEYFRRVDYAFFNYQTLKEKDGAKTERGKIYILHGKPDNVEKTLKEKKQFEIWTYNNLSKKFHFELVSNGLYVLRKIEE